MIAFMILGYSIIAVYLLNDVRDVLRRCRVEVRKSFGRRVVYLRERKTGRLIGCSRNPFTLILQVTT